MTSKEGSGDVRESKTRVRARRGFWEWLSLSLLLALAVLVVVGEVVVGKAGPILKGRVIETLSTRFDSRVELDRLDVSLVKGLQVSGGGLRIFAPDQMVAAGVTRPILSVRQFSFFAGLRGLFLKPMHIGTVHVGGLEIHIPPRQLRSQPVMSSGSKHAGKIKMIVDDFSFTDSRLVIDTLDSTKVPKDFELQQVDLHRVGTDQPLRYDATLVNAIPKGDIHATGGFGPWVTESPGDSFIDGHYTFDHADLDPIKGIGGKLHSTGDFEGRLNHIEVAGTAEVPDFSLDWAKMPVPLTTRFQAVVDGTTGDTYLNQVDARLKNSAFTCKGSIVNIRGKGHVTDLDIDIPKGNVQDFLDLAVKTRPVVMTAKFTTKVKVHVSPGKESMMQKLEMRAGFRLRQVHFTNPKFQEKIDDLSERAQGKPAEANAGLAPVVASEMTGRFVLSRGRMDFSDVAYTAPGMGLDMEGVYTLDGEQFDFHGKARLEAKPSQMVSSWWKQLLLKPVDPFFAKHGAGTEVPFKVSGTKSEPKFGLDFGRKP